MANRTKRTPKNEEHFLNALASGLSVTAAAEAAGIGRRTAYEWRDEDDAFRAAWDNAVEAGTDRLEDIAFKRAAESSDTLLIFMLKGRRGEKYADRVKSENINRNYAVSDSPEEVSADEWLAQNQPSSGDRKQAPKPH